MDQVLTRAIILTLGYSDQFFFPLKAAEVHRRLIGFSASLQEVKDTLDFLETKKLLWRYGEWYSVNLAVEKLVTQRLEAEKLSKSHEKEIQDVVSFVSKIPWIYGVLVTGSVAVGNARADDDTDFYFIVAPHTLWLSRLILFLFAWYKGKRRTWNHEEKRSWCFNMWSDTESLVVPQADRSIYTAYEVTQARFVFARHQVMQDFYAQNRWVTRLLPNWKTQEFEISDSWVSQAWLVLLPFVLSLNVCCYTLQQLYMSSHRTVERIEYGFAGFHPRNTKFRTFHRWGRSIAAWYWRCTRFSIS